MSIIAWFLTRVEQSDKIPLAWVTDPNPQRYNQIALFNKLNPEVKLRLDPDNSGTMKTIVQSAAGMGADIIGHVYYDSSLGLYLDAGILMDLTDIAPKLGFSYKTLPKQVQSLFNVRVYDAKNNTLKYGQYTYPANIVHTYLIYNKNVFDKYNVPYPTDNMNWKEFIELAKKITIRKPEELIPEVFGFDGAVFRELLLMNQTNLVNAEGTRSLMGSKGFINAAVEYNKLIYDYKVVPNADEVQNISSQGGWGGANGMSFMAQGKIAMIVGGRWMLILLRRYRKLQMQERKKFLDKYPDRIDEAPQVMRFGACLLPKGKNGKNTSYLYGRGIGVNRNTKNPEAALKLMSFLASKEYAALINKGADAKPGPEKYQKLNLFLSKEFMGEKEVHEASLRAIPFGQKLNTSLLVDGTVIHRYCDHITEKLKASRMTKEQIARICKYYSDELDRTIARSVKREPTKKKIYKLLLKEGAEPIKYEVK